MSDADVLTVLGEQGIADLTAAFYRRVRTDDLISPMYPDDDWEGAQQRLAGFLIYRFGGSDDYIQQRGHPRLRMRHAPFAIGVAERDRWLELNVCCDGRSGSSQNDLSEFESVFRTGCRFHAEPIRVKDDEDNEMVQWKRKLLGLLFTALFVCGVCCFNRNAVAQLNPAQNTPAPVGFQNWQLPTLGGSQYWTDVRFVGGWKIQRNSETGHHRLLDGNSIRHGWGNLAHCNQQLAMRMANGLVTPNRGKVVITLHGLVRSNLSMKPVADYLQNQGQYSIVNFEYASSRKPIEVHAADLKSVIDGLGPEVTEINFVCHSLGNIIVRCYVGDAMRAKANNAGANANLGGVDPRIKRMVMLGPPNHGSQMARMFKNSLLFKSIAGASGSQLGQHWETLRPKLGTPPFEFGIIASCSKGRTILRSASMRPN